RGAAPRPGGAYGPDHQPPRDRGEGRGHHPRAGWRTGRGTGAARGPADPRRRLRSAPAAPGAHRRPRARRPPRSGGGRRNGGAVSAPPLILLVEDDRLLRQAFRLLLEDSGYRVREAGSGREALAAAAEAPAAIVLDLG